MVELVDTPVLGTGAFGRKSSSLFIRTTILLGVHARQTDACRPQSDRSQLLPDSPSH